MKMLEMDVFVNRLLISAALVAAVTSCVKAEFDKDLPAATDKITFDVGLASAGPLTRAANGDFAPDVVEIETASGMENLCLTARVSDLGPQQQILTKGTPVDGTNLGTVYGNFVVNAKGASSTTEFSMDNVEVTYNPSTSSWATADAYYWPKTKVDVDFWFYSPKSLDNFGGTRTTPVVDFANKKMTFTYTMDSGKTSEGKNIDAAKQPDLLFAHMVENKDKEYGSAAAGHVNVNFDHALSGIRFVAGQTDECTINSISLDDIVTKGDCTYDPSNAMPARFAWAVSSYAASFTKTVTQTFDVSINEEKSGDQSKYQDITDAGNKVERTFMAIPQSYAGKTLTVKYTAGGKEYTTTAELPEISSQSGHTKEWLAGKRYTYVLSMKSENKPMEITVDEGFDGTTKTNVKVKNTGEVNAYIRIAVVANWINKTAGDNYGKVVRYCKDWMTAGTLTGKNWGSSTEDWALGNDGWFYYKKAVAPEKETKALFTSYKSGAAPMAGVALDMEIIVQAVEYDSEAAKAKAAWGSNVPLTSDLEQ